VDATRSVRGVVLAGGYPWNESTFDALAPRVLLQAGHQPLIAWALSWLEEAGIRDVTICANPATAEPIAGFVEDTFPSLRATLSVDASPRGPAGCVKDAVEPEPARSCVVVDGAVVPTSPLRPLLDRHWEQGAAATVVAHEDLSCGAGPALRVPSGTYVFEARALRLVPDRGFFDIKENLIPWLYSQGEAVVAQVLPGSCPRVLNSGTYLAVNHWLVERLSGELEAPEGYVSLGELVAHASARIGLGAILAGPVLIGPEATVMSGATVVGPASIGARSQVHSGALVSRSVLWSNAIVRRDALVDHSILADHAVVEEAGTLVGGVRAGRRPSAPERNSESGRVLDFFPVRARSTV